MNWYRNLKISIKLIIGFLIVAFIAGLIGIMGIFSLNNVGNRAKVLYENGTAPMVDLAAISDLYQLKRIDLRNLILVERNVDIKVRIDEIYSKVDQIQTMMAEYEKTLVEDRAKEKIKNFYSAYDDYLIIMESIIQNVQEGNKAAAAAMLLDESMINTAVDVQNILVELLDMKVTGSKSQYDDILQVSKSTKITMLTLSVFGVIIAVIFGIVISGIISKPIIHIVEVAKKLALGDVNVTVEAKYKDETGILANAFKDLAENTRAHALAAEKMAQGDFSIDVELPSENDVLGKALNKMIGNLNELLGNIASSAEQVAGGSKQISDSSMILSESSTEQASSVEELTASLEEISSQTEKNAENANKANELTSAVKTHADKSNDQMKEMLKAMDEINISSNNINRIIKVIDDIAFQTNILALNAAVEAARAGQYGKGFAVVAEEVRTLAAKSADAAKETTELIENSIIKVNDGTKIASETAESLSNIVNEIDKIYDLINDIASASNEQAIGISQINQGIIQVSDVVQTNSATAEESAAASEELASQAELLESLVSQFKLKNLNKTNSGINRLNPEILDMIESMVNKNKDMNKDNNILADDKPSIILNDSEFGKY